MAAHSRKLFYSGYTYNIIFTTRHPFYVCPQLGKINFSFCVVDVRRLINKDPRHLQPWVTRTLRPSGISLDVLEDQAKVTLGPSGVHIAHHSHIGMACQLRYVSLIVLIWEIVQTWTIVRINEDGKRDIGICGDAATS